MCIDPGASLSLPVFLSSQRSLRAPLAAFQSGRVSSHPISGMEVEAQTPVAINQNQQGRRLTDLVNINRASCPRFALLPPFFWQSSFSVENEGPAPQSLDVVLHLGPFRSYPRTCFIRLSKLRLWQNDLVTVRLTSPLIAVNS